MEVGSLLIAIMLQRCVPAKFERTDDCRIGMTRRNKKDQVADARIITVDRQGVCEKAL